MSEDSKNEDAIDMQVNTILDSLRHGFAAMDSDNYRVDGAASFMGAVWAYHSRTRERAFDEACRIIRRSADRLLSEDSNLDKDTVDTLVSHFIASIQKSRSPIKKAGS